jgi:hypothetical protein
VARYIVLHYVTYAYHTVGVQFILFLLFTICLALIGAKLNLHKTWLTDRLLELVCKWRNTFNNLCISYKWKLMQRLLICLGVTVMLFCQNSQHGQVCKTPCVQGSKWRFLQACLAFHYTHKIFWLLDSNRSSSKCWNLLIISFQKCLDVWNEGCFPSYRSNMK